MKRFCCHCTHCLDLFNRGAVCIHPEQKRWHYESPVDGACKCSEVNVDGECPLFEEKKKAPEKASWPKRLFA